MTMTAQTETRIARPAPDTLDLTRRYAAPPALLWRLWTDPVHFARWWGPMAMRCTKAEIDLRPGGRWLATIEGESGSRFTINGAYREIDPPRRLVFTWQWLNESGPGHESEVTLTLAPDGEGCLLRLVHRGLGPDQPDTHLKGWCGCLDSLAASISNPPT